MTRIASDVPDVRVRVANVADPRAGGRHVLYWMTAARRLQYNFALERAVDWARSLELPLIVLEALRVDYRWASDRLHAFVLAGMADNARALDGAAVRYYPYVERRPRDGKGLVETLAADAAVVVTDDYPCFFIAPMVAKVAARLPVRCEAVDGNGLLPMRSTDHDFPTAYAFRRHLQRELAGHLGRLPRRDPLARLAGGGRARLPGDVARRWPAATRAELERPDRLLARLPIDHQVAPVAEAGGRRAAARLLTNFLGRRLPEYADGRNRPETPATSGLSPYLHFGHISAHEIFVRLARREGWSRERLASTAAGKRSGWWGMSPPAEAFLDQLVTWRELGFNFCVHRSDHDRYASLPAWARDTLGQHAADPRPHVYGHDAFAAASTHDPIWNAAQRQLVREGTIHNYLRMLWGKKILEWTRSPEEALDVMIDLNNRYALDGRDPNSYSGILWVLGRYDRPWGPERAVFGKIRYMSSDNTARKMPLGGYLEHYGKVDG